MTGPHGPRADTRALLLEGEVRLEGRVMPASNATFVGSVGPDGGAVGCVYKPVAGERPLWDFPDGTLARREVAAYAVSEALGWRVVPPTVLREGPAGLGMVQAWCEPDPEQAPVDLVSRRRVPEGYLHVLDAYDGEDRPISLVHEDSVGLRRMAVFDVLVNNADRKGGHVLAMADGHRFGVDHGVSFHVDDKLRTVLWGWAGDPLDAADADAVSRVLDRACSVGDPLRAELDELLAGHEVEAFVARCERLLRRRRMPSPSGEWPAIPWPAF
jgi:uncharacterized repeat protein (TIGR03843 family)